MKYHTSDTSLKWYQTKWGWCERASTYELLEFLIGQYVGEYGNTQEVTYHAWHMLNIKCSQMLRKAGFAYYDKEVLKTLLVSASGTIYSSDSNVQAALDNTVEQTDQCDQFDNYQHFIPKGMRRSSKKLNKVLK